MASTVKFFDELPSGFSINRADHYLAEVLPVIPQDGHVEFTLSAVALRLNHERHYASILRGVKMTSLLLQAVSELVNRPELDKAQGELEPIINTLRELLARPRLATICRAGKRLWFWNTLRYDQTFRVAERIALVRILALIAEIDCLMAMCDTTANENFTLPEPVSGALHVEGEGLYHPFVTEPVANPIWLNQNQRVLFLTGPNMAGKTTYLRSVALATYLAHLGMGVPATRFKFSPADSLFSSISLNDDLRGGVSYFRAEALRVKRLAESIAAGHRVLAVLDEPFKGTNIKDAYDASKEMLSRFKQKQNCLFIYSSHLIELGDDLDVTDQIDCRYFEAQTNSDKLQFDYTLRSGISEQRLGMRVLTEEQVFEYLDKN